MARVALVELRIANARELRRLMAHYGAAREVVAAFDGLQRAKGFRRVAASDRLTRAVRVLARSKPPRLDVYPFGRRRRA